MKYQSLAVAAAIASIAACGGSNKGSGGAAPSGGDAGADVIAPTEAGGGVEAGDDDGSAESSVEPPDDGPWPAAHYPIPLMTDNGGPVLAAPELVTVTFVGNPDRDALRTFDSTFAEGTPWWTAVSSGYGVGAVKSGGNVELPDTVSGTTLNDDAAAISDLIISWVASGALPTPDGNTVYVIFFPASTTITFEGGNSCQTFGGYHSEAEVPTEGGIVLAPYAVIPNCPQTGTDQPMADTTDATSHEVIETATDPHNVAPAWAGYDVAWFRQGRTPVVLEVADACETYAPVTDSNGYALTRSWSDTAAKASSDPCQPELPGEIFYDLAVPTTTQSPGTAGDPPSDGYIVVQAGQTQTIDSVFFSEAKLPNDAQITVGGRGQQGSLNPTITAGVTAAVSPTAAHNGMHVALTITTAATATNGDYSVRVRSTLKTGDSHDWPIILRIQGGSAPTDAGHD
jgi:hypothetical protein